MMFESPALDVIKQLLKFGANVTYNDDFIPTVSIDKSTTYETTPLSNIQFGNFDCICGNYQSHLF